MRVKILEVALRLGAAELERRVCDLDTDRAEADHPERAPRQLEADKLLLAGLDRFRQCFARRFELARVVPGDVQIARGHQQPRDHELFDRVRVGAGRVGREPPAVQVDRADAVADRRRPVDHLGRDRDVHDRRTGADGEGRDRVGAVGRAEIDEQHADFACRVARSRRRARPRSRSPSRSFPSEPGVIGGAS